MHTADTQDKLECYMSRVAGLLRPLRQSKSIRLSIIMASVISLSYTIIFTQSNSNAAFAADNNNSSSTNNSKNTGLIQSGNNSNSTIPMMSKISKNGTYLVQLKWSNPTAAQSPNIPANRGFDMEVLFLNSSAPIPNAKTVPQKETKNVSGETTLNASGFTQPGILQRLMPVDSYDISIYDSKGHVLWNKTHEMPRAGSGFERVTFSNPYKGEITIQINNIKSGAAAAARGASVDSVKFETKIS
ncbi:MAG TPA: hypothetical protein VH796_12230 [Nitrososphaeraceae archaeon]